MNHAPLIIVTVVFAAGLATGLLIGQQDAPAGKTTVIRVVPAAGEAPRGPSPQETRPGRASPAGWMAPLAGRSAGTLEAALREERRRAVPGDAGAGLRQQVLLEWLARQDAPRALQLAHEFDLRGDGTATALVLSAMAGADPAGAAAVVAQRLAVDDPHAALFAASVAVAWARGDVPAAAAWARALPAAAQAEAWCAVAAVQASADPAGAAAFIAELPPGASRAHGCASVAEIWARAAPDAALAWAAGLSHADRFTAMPAALSAFAENDPASAAAWLRRQTETVSHPQETAAVIRVWTARDPAAAAAWVAAWPATPGQAQAMQHLVYDWTARDPEAASAWLNAQPGGPARDDAVAQLSLQVTATDPSAAAAWAASIQDPRPPRCGTPPRRGRMAALRWPRSRTMDGGARSAAAIAFPIPDA